MWTYVCRGVHSPDKYFYFFWQRETWIQSTLANIQPIITGEFENAVGRGSRNGPVVFSSRNIKYQSLKDYETEINEKERKCIFARGLSILTVIKSVNTLVFYIMPQVCL